MNVNIFTNQMIGQWISQSTSYSLIYNNASSLTFINNFTWKYIEKEEKKMDLLLPKLRTRYIIDQMYLYAIEFKDNKFYQDKYYVILLNQKSNPSILLKLNNEFKILNKFTIKDYSTKHLSLTSHINQVIVFQQIYFLNNNVKVIKSIAKKNRENIGTYFSSEIRIS